MNNYLLTKNEKIDRILSFSIAFQIVLLGCKNVLVQASPLLYWMNAQLNNVIIGASLLLYVYCFFKSSNRVIRGGFVPFAIFVAMTFAVTYLFFEENVIFLKEYLPRTIVCCLFTGYIVSKLQSFEWLKHYMLKGSYLIIISSVGFVLLVRIIGHITTSEWSTYSMSMSNVVLVAVIWQLYSYFKSKNKIALVSAILGTVVIFMYGSRNPLLAIAFYTIIQFADGSNTNGKAKASLKKLLLIIASIVFLLGGKSVLKLLISILGSWGLGGRTLFLLENSDTEDFSTGRDDIHAQVWRLLEEHPFGIGISGADYHIHEMAHSFYLSILCTYGYIIGVCFIAYIFFKCYKALKRAIGIDHQILVIYLCLVFPRGFTGGDIWQNDVFWFMMGLVFSIFSKQYITRKYENKVSAVGQVINCQD